jgi:hypothetical protein
MVMVDNALNIFLLIGQSNMAGRGRLDDVPPLRHSQVRMFRQGNWIVADEPLHTDKPDLAGVGLGMSFAVELIVRGRLQSIGLVPCAFGGTSLSAWLPGAALYENAVAVTREALSGGRLSGILWHQGESDSGQAQDAASYGERFQQMLHRLRHALGAEAVPVIAGELGAFLRQREPADHALFDVINRQLRQLVGKLPVYACVSASGLTDNGDHLHFDALSLRELGRRYADAYEKLIRGGG